jgi:hypothetical protein
MANAVTIYPVVCIILLQLPAMQLADATAAVVGYRALRNFQQKN